ncbi:MAG: hypothetical protein EPO23_03895 [Xanthobacteraceae bacterium]|nr:MAG: hypothetical protein EPO23_03895 [Xanthobacteraceae bacterium]
MQIGISIIKEEHRAVAAVIHGLNFYLQEITQGKLQPDFPLFRAIFQYIQEFPHQLHHPKEEAYLFKAVRARTHDADTLIARLERDHADERIGVKTIEAALDKYEKYGASAFDEFHQIVTLYAQRAFKHIHMEEEELIPIARRVLTSEDWKTINAAFHDNKDPLIDPDTRHHFREMFARIISMAPNMLG